MFPRPGQERGSGSTPVLAGGTPILGYPSPHPSKKNMGPVEVLWDGDGGYPPAVNRQTPVKTLPCHIPSECAW